MADDAAILQALRAGDASALAALFDTYADRLYRLAQGLLRNPDEAEDVVQETFLKALTHLDRFEGRSRLSTWLYRVAYNASIDRLRRQGESALPSDDRETEEAGAVPLPQVLVEWRTPEEILIDAEAQAALDEAIQALSESLRVVFVLRDIEGLSTAETAQVLGISPGAVKVRLHRARLALRERLALLFAGPPGGQGR